jgi:hypothetical protein
MPTCQHQPVAGRLQRAQLAQPAARHEQQHAQQGDGDARDGAPSEPLAQDQERHDSQHQRRDRDDPAGIARRRGRQRHRLDEEMDGHDDAAEGQPREVGAREVRAHAQQEHEAAEERHADRQPRGEDFEGAELRDQNLGADERPTPDDDGGEQQDVRDHSIALTTSSTTFFASPNTIIVRSR